MDPAVNSDSDAYLKYLAKPSRRRYEHFVREYLDAIHRLATQLCRDSSAAEDLTQETFLKLAKTANSSTDSKARPEIRSPRAYVLRTVVNLHRDRLRRLQTRARYEEEAGMEQAQRFEPSAASKAASRETVSNILKAIASLPEELGTALHLRAVEGLSYREISDATDTSEETVGTRIHRARKELKTILGVASTAIVLSTLEQARAQGTLPTCDTGLVELVVSDFNTGSAGATSGSKGSTGSGKLLTVVLIVSFSVLLLFSGGPTEQHQTLPIVSTSPVGTNGPPGAQAVLTPAPNAVIAAPVEARQLRVSGRFIDRETGDVVANQKVRLDHGYGSNTSYHTTTNAEGRFGFRPADLGWHYYGFRVPGYQRVGRHLPTKIIMGELTSWDLGDIDLSRGARLTILVRDLNGEIIPDARVQAEGRAWEACDDLGRWSSIGFRMGEENTVRIDAPSFAERRVQLKFHQDHCELVQLEPTSFVVGRVVNASDAPLANVGLGLSKEFKSHATRWGYDSQETTDAKGSFRIEVPSNLPFKLWLESGNRQLLTVQVPELEPGKLHDLKTLVVSTDLFPARVRILDENARPVPNFRFYLDGSAMYSTDAKGESDVLARAEEKIHLADPRYLNQRGLAITFKENSSPPLAAIIARKGPAVRGTLRGSNGRVLAERGVRLTGPNGQQEYAWIGPTGEFAFRVTPGLPWSTIIETLGKREARVIEDFPEGGILDLEVNTEKPERARIEARIRSLDRGVVDGHLMALYLMSSTDYAASEASFVDEKALFFDHETRYLINTKDVRVLFVHESEGFSDFHTFPRDRHAVHAVDVELKPFAELEVSIVNEHDRPIEGAYLIAKVFPEGMKSPLHQRTIRTYSDEEGRVQLSRLIAGRHELWCHSSMGIGRAEVTLASADAKSLLIKTQAGGTVEGRMLLPSGEPITHAPIRWAFQEFEEESKELPYFGKTDGEGRFRFEGLPAGISAGYVTIPGPDRRPKESSFQVEVRAKEVTQVELTIKPR